MASIGRLAPRSLVGLGCALAVTVLLAGDSGVHVTREMLQVRIDTARDSAELDEASRLRLIDLYRRAQSDLAIRAVYDASAEEYRRAGRDAPAETERMREALERRRATDPTADLADLSSVSLKNLARMLDDEIANLTAVETKLAMLEARIEAAARRSPEARALIAAARSESENLVARSGERRPQDDSPEVVEAARWAADTRLDALHAEIAMLDQDLLSLGARTDRLRAERDDTALGVRRIRERIDVLGAAVTERRRMETDLAMAEARAALAGASSGEPRVRELAEANLALVERLREQLVQLDAAAARELEQPSTTRIESAFRSARQRLELVGSHQPVGMAVLAERRQFPSAREFTSDRRTLVGEIDRVSLRLIESEEERRALADRSAYLDRRLAGSRDALPDPRVRKELEKLATTRRSLLDRAIESDVALQRRLSELDDRLERLSDLMSSYDDFLARRLLWVRSSTAIDAAEFARLPREVRSFVAPDRWWRTIRELVTGGGAGPAWILITVGAGILVWRRERLRASLVECGRNVGIVGRDRIVSTWRALGLTLMLAAPLPLVLGAIGGALSLSGDADPFPSAVGAALLKTASWIALPLTLRALFLPGGVAERHLGWDGATLTKLRRQLALFVGFAFPLFLVLRTSLAVEPPEYVGGMLTFLCFVGINVNSVVLTVGIGHPTRGTVRAFLASRSSGERWRWRFVGFPFLILMPVAMVALAWFGYGYAAQELFRRLFLSIWVLVVVWLVSALVRRWLRMTSRRIAAREARSGGVPFAPGPVEVEDRAVAVDADEPEIDLDTLGADSHRLLNAAALLAAALALVAVWGDMFPALAVLEQVKLWSHTVQVDGMAKLLPVTLFDVVVAAVFGVGGYVLARNVPSLLDIILLRQGRVGTGARYTAGTLIRYAITAVTVLVVLQRLGASGSQLGWAAAALGVGIGFGLQEIVANFICGLILLFERPVRVGDVVTIGDASGTVSKIRIRATTIRDWEQKELVVPNKELITGRLLNWTLSDAVTRVYLAVGVAYGSDVERAMTLMREAAEENPLVLDEPEPRVHFEQFGDSSLRLTLRAYTADVFVRLNVSTELHQAINRKFREAGIVIAFPQRDVHLR